MSLKWLILTPLALLVVTAFLVMRVMRDPSQAAQPVSQAKSDTPAVETIADPSQPPEMADGPGKDVFIAKCMNCHSPRYVTMQPRFPRKVWKAEVTKMVSAYKASIEPAQQDQIVDYLVAAYGVPASK
jgi:mono/diheme cytochrome c family protein